MTDAELTMVNMDSASMPEAKFIRTNLVQANMTFARMNRADFSRSNLYGAILRNASLMEVFFCPYQFKLVRYD